MLLMEIMEGGLTSFIKLTTKQQRQDHVNCQVNVNLSTLNQCLHYEMGSPVNPLGKITFQERPQDIPV